MNTLIDDIRELLTEQVRYRELLFQMTYRDLLLRYKQTAMGFAWAVFMPLVNTAIFSIVFMRVAAIQTDVPYPLFAYSGLAIWNFTASSLRFSVNSLTSNTTLVTKIYLPREIFPFSAVIVCFVDFLVSAIVLIAFMVYFKVAPTASILWLPLILLMHVAFTTGLCLMLAMANLFYRDVKYLFEVVTTVWMFSSSVLYPLSELGGRLGLIALFNPMTPIIDSYRAALFGTAFPTPAALAFAATVSVVMLVGSWITFHRAEYSFAENV